MNRAINTVSDLDNYQDGRTSTHRQVRPDGAIVLQVVFDDNEAVYFVDNGEGFVKSEAILL